MSAEKIRPLACPEPYSAERSGSAFVQKSGDYKELKTSWRVYIRTRTNFIKLKRWLKFEGLVLLDVIIEVNWNEARRLLDMWIGQYLKYEKI